MMVALANRKEKRVVEKIQKPLTKEREEAIKEVFQGFDKDNLGYVTQVQCTVATAASMAVHELLPRLTSTLPLPLSHTHAHTHTQDQLFERLTANWGDVLTRADLDRMCTEADIGPKQVLRLPEFIRLLKDEL